jgi:hypothetical protein
VDFLLLCGPRAPGFAAEGVVTDPYAPLRAALAAPGDRYSNEELHAIKAAVGPLLRERDAQREALERTSVSLLRLLDSAHLDGEPREWVHQIREQVRSALTRAQGGK